MWNLEQLDVIKKDNITGLGHFLLGFGQNNSGEMFILTTDKAGPVGNTGKVYKLVSSKEEIIL